MKFSGECNIDAKGKAARLIWGVCMLLISGVLLILLLSDQISGWGWWAGVALGALLGVFGIYEGRKGWCALRAMGFKTPM